MTRKKPRSASPGKATGAPDSPPAGAPRRRTELTFARGALAGQWRLVHPPCARDRDDDLAEVRRMIDAGELDVATDELRWLLEDCRDLLAAHRLLGEIALETGDMALARAHFGYAFDIARAALPADGLDGTLPCQLPENEALHEAAKGLAWALHELGRREQALTVVRQMLAWDPADPLGVSAWLTRWQAETDRDENGQDAARPT